MTDHRVALVTPWNRQGGIATYSTRFKEVLEEAEIRVTPIPIENPNSANPLGFLNLIDRISADTDVVHVQFEAGVFGRLWMSGIGAPAFFLALRRIDASIVTTLHEVHREHHHRGAIGSRLLRGRDWLIERLALRASDTIIVHTREAERVLRDRHGDEWQIERMLHPAEPDVDQRPTEKAKDDLGVSGPVALTFGFVEEKKRYEDVIRALPEFPSLTYLIAGGLREGEGEEVLERCRDLAAELGVADRLRYLGYVDEDDVPTVFSAADIVVLPYERVSQSGVVNEALAYRRPVVATSVPAFEELQDEYRCLLTYQDQFGLRDALASVLRDERARQRLRRRGDEYVASVSWENFGEQSIQLYRNI